MKRGAAGIVDNRGIPPLAGVCSYEAAAQPGLTVDETVVRLKRVNYVLRRLHELAAAHLPSTPEWEVKCALVAPPLARCRARGPRARTGRRDARASAAPRRRARRAARRGLRRGDPRGRHRRARRRRSTSRRAPRWSTRSVTSSPRSTRSSTSRPAACSAPSCASRRRSSPGQAPPTRRWCRSRRRASAPSASRATSARTSPPPAAWPERTPRPSSSRPPAAMGARTRWRSGPAATIASATGSTPPRGSTTTTGTSRGRSTSGRGPSPTSGCARWTSPSGWRRSSSRRAASRGRTPPSSSGQLWDETRHAMMGEVSLVSLGIPFYDYPIDIAGSATLNLEFTPLEAHILLWHVEQELMSGETGKRFEWAAGERLRRSLLRGAAGLRLGRRGPARPDRAPLAEGRVRVAQGADRRRSDADAAVGGVARRRRRALLRPGVVAGVRRACAQRRARGGLTTGRAMGSSSAVAVVSDGRGRGRPRSHLIHSQDPWVAQLVLLRWWA